MPDPSPTPPRPFRFGLRSLFVLVTVVSIATAWVTYSLNWIRQRRDAIIHVAVRTNVHGLATPTAPAGLWLLGESGFAELVTDNSEVERLRSLFPEAKVLDPDEYMELNDARIRGLPVKRFF